MQAAQPPPPALVEARCLRLAAGWRSLGCRPPRYGVGETSHDEHELMLALEELAACEEAAGDLQSALADTQEVTQSHPSDPRGPDKTARATSLVTRGPRTGAQQSPNRGSEATRSAEEDILTGIGNRRLLERFSVKRRCGRPK